jgi:hypothetical protein
MPIGSATVGSNTIPLFILQDPTTAGYQQNIAPMQGDSRNLSTQQGAYTLNAPCLVNPVTSNYDQQRAAVGTVGVLAVNTEGTKKSYGAAIVGFTPAATATDFFQILGSGSLVVRVTRITISGIATAAASIDIQLVKRTTANTGGTQVAATMAAYDSNDAGATAVVNSYSANPSVLGTSAGNIRGAKLNLGAAGAAGSIVWDFTTRNAKAVVLRGAAQSLALNWNGAAVPSGTSVDIDIEWTEE